MPEPDPTTRYVAYPRGPQLSREEGANSLRLLGQGYFTLRYCHVFLIMCVGICIVERINGYSINLVLGQILAGGICFVLALGSLGRIGRALSWNWSSYATVSLVYAMSPLFWSFIPNKIGFEVAAILTVMAFQTAIGRIVKAEIARYGIRLHGWSDDAVRQNFREDVEKYETGPRTPDPPFLSVADHVEVG